MKTIKLIDYAVIEECGKLFRTMELRENDKIVILPPIPLTHRHQALCRREHTENLAAKGDINGHTRELLKDDLKPLA